MGMTPTKINANLEKIHAEVFDRVDNLAIAVDEQGVIQRINRGAARILGVSVGAYLGQPLRTLLQADPPERGNEKDVVEYHLNPRTADARWLRGHWVDVQDESSCRIARLFVGQDFTREYNLQRDLIRSAALAELGLMAAEVAHEVNNPATYLMANLSILRDDMGSGEIDADGAIELIEECLDGITRITDVVKRMRSLASSGGEEIGEDLVDLSTVVRDACRIAGLRVKYKAELHIHDEETVQVRGSPKRLGQVVLNLVVNAADALTGQSAPMPRIDVSVSQSGTWAEVIVRDNGPGVPVEKREHIFQAFFSSKLEHGGTGLGLAVSRTIATEHGGRLYLESKEGSGACFILRLPLPASLN
jgi:signal transduction histidine kinase